MLQNLDESGHPSSILPQRPGAPDCLHYVRTGMCHYGTDCRFNHKVKELSDEAHGKRDDYPEQKGQPECQFYLKTGTCKFGSACRYHHPREKAGIMGKVKVNTAGYPLRLGEVNCAYYMQTGTCKFGIACRFNHPQPAAGSFSAFPLWPQLHRQPSLSGLPVRSACYSSFFIPAEGLVSAPGWTPYQGQLRHMASVPHVPMSQNMFAEAAMCNPNSRNILTSYSPYPVGSAATGLLHPVNLSSIDHFPKRPGQPECKHYMKTGNCKFGALCHFDHPKLKTAPQSDHGAFRFQALPQRPGTQPCAYYMQYGACMFGLTCRYDHPTLNFSYHSLPQSYMTCTYPQSLAFPKYRDNLSANALAVGHAELSEKDNRRAVMSRKSEVVDQELDSGELRDGINGGKCAQNPA